VLLYYKSTDPNPGWHDAADIAGFLSDADAVVLDGYYGVVVNHSGIVALSVR
jgi:hypothetical protein